MWCQVSWIRRHRQAGAQGSPRGSLGGVTPSPTPALRGGAFCSLPLDAMLSLGVGLLTVGEYHFFKDVNLAFAILSSMCATIPPTHNQPEGELMDWKTGKLPSGTEANLLQGGPFPVAVVPRLNRKDPSAPPRGFSVFAQSSKPNPGNPRGATGSWEKVAWIKGSESEVKSKVERGLSAL